MKKLKINKKIILIILTLILIISISFNYIRLKGKRTNDLLETESENHFVEKSKRQKVSATNLKIKSENLEVKNNSKSEVPVEKLATIEEIKNPFKIDKKFASQSLDKTNKNNSDELVSLEKNIIQKVKNDKLNESNDLSLKMKKKPNLDFKLIGIIKNKKQAAALFLYQGQTILKKEEEEIGSFQIKNINKKEVILNYHEQEIKLNLWEDLKNGS